MLKTLEQLGSQVQNILNNHPKFQEAMTALQMIAVKKNLTKEQWQELKERIFQSAVIYILLNDKGLRKQLGEEVYEELLKQA